MAKAKKAATSKRRRNRRIVITVITLSLVFVGISVLQNRPAPTSERFAKVDLPDWVMQHGSAVAEAYAYAAEHQDVLQYMACYCGCENHGHDSNAACYVRESSRDGKLEWDSHAAT